MNKENLEIKKEFKLLILLLLLASLFFINQDNLESLFSLEASKKQIEFLESLDVPGALDISIYEENIMVWDGDKLSIFDIEGNLKIEREFKFENSLIHFGNNHIYIADKDTGNMYKLNIEGETINNIDFKNPFLNIEEENGNTLYHVTSEGSENIYIYNKDDLLIGEHSFVNKNILSYDISNVKKGYSISAVELYKDNLKSKIYFFDKNNKEMYSIDIDNQIVLHNQYIDKENMAILTDKSLYSIRKENIVWEKSFNLIKDMYIADKIYILHSNYLESIDFQGKTINTLGFDENYQNIISLDKDVFVYGENGFTLVSDGRELLKYDGHLDLINISAEFIIILNDEKLNIYKILSA